MCIDNVEIWSGIDIGQTSLILTGLSARYTSVFLFQNELE